MRDSRPRIEYSLPVLWGGMWSKDILSSIMPWKPHCDVLCGLTKIPETRYGIIETESEMGCFLRIALSSGRDSFQVYISNMGRPLFGCIDLKTYETIISWVRFAMIRTSNEILISPHLNPVRNVPYSDFFKTFSTLDSKCYDCRKTRITRLNSFCDFKSGG